MKNRNQIVCVLIFLFFSCEERFDFTTDRLDNTRIIIDGFIHQGNNPYAVNISQLSASGSPTKVGRAEVRIFNRAEESVLLEEEGTGVYVSDTRLGFGKPGNDYYLFVKLNSGSEFKSDWVTMPLSKSEDVLSWKELSRRFTSDLGTDFLLPVVSISLDVLLNTPQKEPLFLSWLGEEVYQFVPTDFPDPFGSIPPPCYIVQPFGSEEINLFSTLGFQGANYSVDEIFWREVDDSFLRKHIFSLYSFSHNESHYQYLREIESLVENTGSLFDTPPGLAKGNIVAFNGGDEDPLGYFGAVIADTTRIAIYPNELVTFIVDDCLFDPSRPNFLDYSEICNNCGLIPRTDQRPDYWLDL